MPAEGPNLALNWLADNGVGVGEIDCVELAGNVGGDSGRIAWIEGENGAPLYPEWGEGCVCWKHHAVAVIDGIAHDPFGPGPMPIKEWVAQAFPGQRCRVEYPGQEEGG